MKLSDLLDFLDDPSAFDVLYKGKRVTYLNEAGAVSDSSRFFVAGFEFGASVLVHVESYRGDGFESAREAWIDSMPEIDKDEYPEAYSPGGKDRDLGSFDDIALAEMRDTWPSHGSPDWEAYREKYKARAHDLLSAAVDAAQNNEGEYPETVEGYEADSSGRIKSVGHYAWMNEADLDDIEIVRKAEVENPSE